MYEKRESKKPTPPQIAFGVTTVGERGASRLDHPYFFLKKTAPEKSTLPSPATKWCDYVSHMTSHIGV